jgi:hypothetical protein
MNSINNYTIRDDQKESKVKPIIDEITRKLFAAFTNKGKKMISLEGIKDLFIPEGIIIKNTGPVYEFYNLQQFIEPREKLLNSGTLIDFEEEELTEQTIILGNIAHRLCVYQKKGVLSGNSFHTKGIKSIQFIKTEEGWKINSLAWDDEKDGLSIV